MSYFSHRYSQSIKYEVLSKFNHSNLFMLPRIKKIVLNIGIKKVNFKSLLSVVTLLEVISCKKKFLTYSKTSNIFLKIRKGYPVGCSVILRNDSMNKFLNNISLTIFSKLKELRNLRISHKNIINIFNFSFENILVFNDLEQKYELFQELVKLDISIVTNSTNLNGLLFLLISYRLPLK